MNTGGKTTPIQPSRRDRREWLRWIAVPCSALLLSWALLCLLLVPLLFGPLPDSLKMNTLGFLIAFPSIFIPARIAPSRQILTSAILFLAFVVLSLRNEGDSAIGVLVAGGLAVGGMAWKNATHRRGLTPMRIALVLFASLAAFLAHIYATNRDLYERPDPWPYYLGDAITPETPDAPPITLYQYDLGGFIDSQHLWRLDAGAPVVAKVIQRLRLQQTNSVPSRFWAMPPHYWPRNMPANAEVFQSPDFSGNDRGPDGDLFLVLHDKNRQRAYIWLKANF